MKYNVIHYCPDWNFGEQGPRWFLADIGMDRETATATMLMYAMRFDEWDGTQFVTAILKGADPEQPYPCQNGVEPGVPEMTTWFCIVREDRDPPPLPTAKPGPPCAA